MASSAPDPVAVAFARPRLILVAALAALTGWSWWWLTSGANISTAPMAMPGMAPPSLAGLTLMWTIMMVAMMVPASAPLVLLYARNRRLHPSLPKSGLLVAGYLLVWAAFALAAALIQSRLLGGAGMVQGTRIIAALLAMTGLYQFTSWKQACLGRCRNPATFLARHFRAGPIGVVRLGVLHGLACLGCCWLLMLLLFVGGVMNLAWVALLALLVSAEKLLPIGPIVARLAGIALIGWAAALLMI